MDLEFSDVYIPVTKKATGKRQKQTKAIPKIIQASGLSLVVPFPDRIRASHVKAFHRCEEQYRLTYVEKVNQPQREAFFNGTLIDEACTGISTLVMQGHNDLPSQTYLQYGIQKAVEYYDNRVAGWMNDDGRVPRWLKGKDEYLFLLKMLLPEWSDKAKTWEIESVREKITLPFLYKKTGEEILIQGELDMKTSNAVRDYKSSKASPKQKRKDDNGDYLLTDGVEKKFYVPSADYVIQMIIYMMAPTVDKNLAVLDYFIKTKVPKLEEVHIHRSVQMEKYLHSIINRYVDAHYENEFVPNIYNEYCNGCQYQGNLCEASFYSREVVE